MKFKILGSCALAALALSACSQPNGGQNASSQAPLAPPSPAETAPAPAASALPPAQSAPVRYAPPAQRYRPLNDAYAMSRTYADAPPDYAFDYDGSAPEAWGSRDGVVRVGERVPGGWRYYYYQPGRAVPYLVRDPDYAYGFDDGQLVVVYDSRGRALPPEWADRQAWLAGRYLARAQDLWRAARERRRMEIEAQVWREQRAEQERQRRYWDETRDADADWRAYHDEHDSEARDRWAAVAAAWAAAQVIGPQQPPQGYEHHRRDGEGGVDDDRQAWRARASQWGPGPAQPPQQRGGWGAPEQGPGPAQPPQQRGGWSTPEQGPGPAQPPAQRGGWSTPEQGPGPAQPPHPRPGWSTPEQGPGPAQPPAQRSGWSTPEHGPGPAQPPAQRSGWSTPEHGPGPAQPPFRWNGQPQGEHPHPAQPQPPARIEPAHAAPPQPPAKVEPAHAAPPQAKPEHDGKPHDHEDKKPEGPNR